MKEPSQLNGCIVRHVIRRILCLNLTVIIRGMVLDKSLAAKLSRMDHSYRASVNTLDGRGADTAVCKKKKTLETGCM